MQELEQYQVSLRRGPRPAPPARPPDLVRGPVAPAAPRPGPAPWSLGCASRVFAVAAEEVGLGGQRAQQELRGIGETFDISVPVFPRPRPPPPFRGSSSWGEVTEPRSGAGGQSGRHRDRGTCPRGGLFCLGVVGFVWVGNGRGGRRGGGGDDSARRFAAGRLPSCRCLR